LTPLSTRTTPERYRSSTVFSGSVGFHVSSGTSIFGGAVGEYASAFPNADVSKTGSGLFEVKHVRVEQLNIGTVDTFAGSTEVTGGTVRIRPSLPASGSGLPDIVGNVDGTSRVERLTMLGGDSTDSTLNLTNNDLIIDYASTSPLGAVGSGTQGTGVAGWIKRGWNGGSWNGTGITSSTANAGTYALGVGEAGTLGLSTFSGQSVDSTAVLVKFTYYADATLDGQVQIADFSRVSANFNQSPRIWQDGDFDYDSDVDIADFGKLSSHFGLGGSGSSSPQLRGGLPPLAELYIAMLDFPQIYWEARADASIWFRFAEFEAMNLGPIPPVPANLLARGIPEPTGLAPALLATM
jgi:hypothetical protein